MDISEQPEPISSYEQKVAATAAEFHLSPAYARKIVGPDDEHSADRIESLRVIRDRVWGAWGEHASPEFRVGEDAPAEAKNKFVGLWLRGVPATDNGNTPAKTFLEIWTSSPEGYVQVLELTQDHVAMVDDLGETDDPTEGYYIA